MKKEIVAWYLNKLNCSIVPLFEVGDLAYANEKGKKKTVEKKVGLIFDTFTDWNTGKTSDVRQMHIVVFVDNIYSTEELARQARDKLLSEFLENTNATSAKSKP